MVGFEDMALWIFRLPRKGSPMSPFKFCQEEILSLWFECLKLQPTNLVSLAKVKIQFQVQIRWFGFPYGVATHWLDTDGHILCGVC